MALTLPETGLKINIREKVFEEIGDKLNHDEGMKNLIEFLDKHLGKDELSEAYDKYVQFERYVRKEDESMESFISTFDSLHQKLSKSEMTLPSPMLCFKLISSANIGPEKEMFIKSDIDYSKSMWNMYSCDNDGHKIHDRDRNVINY